MEQKNKMTLIYIGIALVVLIIVGVYFYRRGKKTVTIQQVPIDNPTQDNGGSTNNNPAGESQAAITELANRLYNEMNGTNFWRDSAPYNDLLLLSDTDFVKVYNTFNTLHQAESAATLKAWLVDEYGIGEFATFKEQILTRMGRLNLI